MIIEVWFLTAVRFIKTFLHLFTILWAGYRWSPFPWAQYSGQRVTGKVLQAPCPEIPLTDIRYYKNDGRASSGCKHQDILAVLNISQHLKCRENHADGTENSVIMLLNQFIFCFFAHNSDIWNLMCLQFIWPWASYKLIILYSLPSLLCTCAWEKWFKENQLHFHNAWYHELTLPSFAVVASLNAGANCKQPCISTMMEYTYWSRQPGYFQHLVHLRSRNPVYKHESFHKVCLYFSYQQSQQ